MSIQELLAGGGGLLLILMTLVQIAPVKVNPWSALAKAIGRAINEDISHRLDSIEKKLDEHISTDDRRAADQARTQILHFNNELLRPIEHTKEEFVEILLQIDSYERYCDEHKEYSNNRAVLAIENIQEVYKERLKKRDFLQDSRPRETEEVLKA